MNAISQTQSIADAIRQVAMVADISTSAIGMTRIDKTASRKADQDHVAKDGASKVVVMRFAGADDKIRVITDLQAQAVQNLKSNSMVWGTTKRRLLPNVNFQRWIGQHTSISDAFDKAIEDLMADADQILAQAKQNIGTYQIALPTKDELKEAFSLSYSLEPIPDPKQFGRILGGEEILGGADKHLQYQFEENMRGAYNNAVQDTAQRLSEPLEKLAERMAAYDRREMDLANGKNPGREGYFRDSIIENVQQISGVFGALNVLGDERLAAIAKKVEAFGRITPDILRKRGDIRQAVADRAKEVLKDLDSILLR